MTPGISFMTMLSFCLLRQLVSGNRGGTITSAAFLQLEQRQRTLLYSPSLTGFHHHTHTRTHHHPHSGRRFFQRPLYDQQSRLLSVRQESESRNEISSSTASTTTASSTRTSLSVIVPNHKRNNRVEILHDMLVSVGIDAERLHHAALRSIEDPTSGYDTYFGKSAIKTYRAFLYPKKKQEQQQKQQEQQPQYDDEDNEGLEDLVLLKASAGRTARQIDFLMKRHQSHTNDLVRHHDTIQERRQIFPLILILDNIRSAFNVGSLYRTADATGCQAVLTCGITPHPHGSGAEKLAKSALGAEHVLETQHFSTTRDAIQYLREKEPEYMILGMETTEQSQFYSNISYHDKKKIALILGNEVTGVDTTLFSDLDLMIEIPTFGAKNSLNVAACAPVVLYEILRQWGVGTTTGRV